MPVNCLLWQIRLKLPFKLRLVYHYYFFLVLYPRSKGIHEYLSRNKFKCESLKIDDDNNDDTRLVHIDFYI